MSRWDLSFGGYSAIVLGRNVRGLESQSSLGRYSPRKAVSRKSKKGGDGFNLKSMEMAVEKAGGWVRHQDHRLWGR